MQSIQNIMPGSPSSTLTPHAVFLENNKVLYMDSQCKHRILMSESGNQTCSSYTHNLNSLSLSRLQGWTPIHITTGRYTISINTWKDSPMIFKCMVFFSQWNFPCIFALFEALWVVQNVLKGVPTSELTMEHHTIINAELPL